MRGRGVRVWGGGRRLWGWWRWMGGGVASSSSSASSLEGASPSVVVVVVVLRWRRGRVGLGLSCWGVVESDQRLQWYAARMVPCAVAAA